MKPPVGETVIVDVPVVPCRIETEDGLAEIPKLPETVRSTVVDFTTSPLVPVMVMTAGPVDAVALAARTSVVDVVDVDGVKVAVTPLGRPLAV